MTFDIVQRNEQFLSIAREMSAIAVSLEASARVDQQHDICARLHALSRDLRRLSTEAAADFHAHIAEFRRVREAVTDRESMFRSFAEDLPHNVVRWDCAGNYLYVNPTHERTLMKSAAELIGTRVPESHDQVVAAITHAVATGEAVPFVRQRVPDGNGELRVHEISIVPERSGEGEILSVFGIGCDVTEQVRIQEAMEASERQFRTLAENLPNFLARYTPDAKITYFNPKLEMLMGCRTDEVAGRTPTQIVTSGVLDELESGIHETVRLGNENQIELVMEQEDGEQITHHIYFVAERDAVGTVVSVLAIGHDITDRKRAEAEQRSQYEEILRLNGRFEKKAQELVEARARLLNVLHTIPDMVWQKDAEGVYLFCNHAFERMTGRREFEIIGKTDYQLFSEEQADFFRARDRAAIEARRISIHEESVTWSDTGERTLLETRKVPLFDAKGDVTGVLGVARDVTERKRIEEMLAGREREFRTLVEHSPDTIVRHDKEFRRVYVNPTFAALVEGDTAELVGNKSLDYLGGPDPLLYEQKLGEVFASGKALEFELHWRQKDGGECCHLVKLTPEYSATGTVECVLAVGRDISELQVSRQKIHRMAYYDQLTALPNRTLFSDRLRQMFGDDSTKRKLAGVMMIDMDRFKGINDTMGHAVGDELLRQAAGRLSTCVRSCDTVARFGGDEFAILLPNIRDRCVPEEISRRILRTFDEPFELNGKEVFVSCSIGIALYPVNSIEADDLMQYADSAMYAAKRSGRRNFRFYSKNLTADAAAHLQLESELLHAIERGELELHYQPKVSLLDNEVIGSEALLRWRRPGVGFVPPSQFIPVAEEAGLITDLGEWVLREACRTAAEWNAGSATIHKVAVNLSARQFQLSDLADTIGRILRETGCRSEWLELEITESLLLEEDETVLGTLSAFRSMGLTIAIDDFGTGYSALYYLARFPIDTLKIDRSFIQQVTRDQRHAELVKAILSIAQCLGQQVVAEGVETAEQAAFLKTNGCQVAQGFLYSKPLPKPDMVSLPRTLALVRARPYC
ncbi:EAL domain-containing protein [Burkholderia anthina]|uniref:EAL domain-containing protein n=1 Tax=Burkholderia anthina TaxID=179879 RepID=UPI00158CDBE0|nr:EAL domain-containing protein [Burkholderia anthina]